MSVGDAATERAGRTVKRSADDEGDGRLWNKQASETIGVMSSAGVFWLPLLVK